MSTKNIQGLLELGADPVLVEAILVNQQTPSLGDSEHHLYSKYSEAGFSEKAKQIRRDKFLRETPYLIIRSLVGNHYAVLDGYGCLPHLHYTVNRKGLFGNRETPKVLALIPISDYEGEVPEFILDTIIRNRKDFADFCIGVPGKVHAINDDPILFAIKGQFPNGFQEQWMDLYVLGLWGTDWVDLSFSNDDLERHL